MTKEERLRMEKALMEFVNRASKEGATPEEIAALPKVADVLYANAYQSGTRHSV